MRASILAFLALSACSDPLGDQIKNFTAQTQEQIRLAPAVRARQEAHNRACITPNGPDLACYDVSPDKQFSVAWCISEVGLYANKKDLVRFQDECFNIHSASDRNIYRAVWNKSMRAPVGILVVIDE